MLWIKSLHIIFVIAWFAGLFYLPRLFVYHSQSDDAVSHERFLLMERKLLGLMAVAATGSIVFGLWLWLGYGIGGGIGGGWMHAKLALVAMLVGFHLYCIRLWRGFRAGHNRHGHVFYRWINELPALLLIAIVILVVVKPF